SKCLQAGKIAELDQLECRAATGRYVIHTIGEIELTHRGRAVATADDGEAAAIRNRFRDRARTGGERRHLEDAHRAVPHDGGRTGQHVGVGAGGLGADVDALPAVGDRLRTYVPALRGGADLLRRDHVG